MDRHRVNYAIAGAPAADWTHLYIGAGLMYFRWLAPGPSYLLANKLPAIHAAVLAACDELGHVKDGVIEDPRQCQFDPSVLLCKGPESDACLSPDQLATVKNLYAGPALHSGKRLWPGYSFGAESGWGDAHLGTGPGTTDTYQDILGFFRNIVFEDPYWDPKYYDAERAGPVTERKLSRVIDANSPDLSKFLGRGGKLIMYHGWAKNVRARKTTRKVRNEVATPAIGHDNLGVPYRQVAGFGNDPDAGLGTVTATDLAAEVVRGNRNGGRQNHLGVRQGKEPKTGLCDSREQPHPSPSWACRRLQGEARTTDAPRSPARFAACCASPEPIASAMKARA